MIGALPESLTIDGIDYSIRSDYRNILHIFEAFSDPDYSEEEKCIMATYLFYEHFSCVRDALEAIRNGFNVEEAFKQMQWFISAGMPDGIRLEAPVYDWKQDEQLIFSSINKVATREVRDPETYLHWWTFLSYFREVGEGVFLDVVRIRNKLNHGKKLEKHEKDFLAHNKELVKLEKPKTKEELEQEAEYKALIDEVLG